MGIHYVLPGLAAIGCALGVKYIWGMSVPKGYKNPWLLRAKIAMLDVHAIGDRLVEHLYGPLYLHIKDRDAASRPVHPVTASYKIETESVDLGGVKSCIYRPYNVPSTAPNPSPCIVYIHGGGWVNGNLAYYDAPCRKLAHCSGMPVIFIDYRLAPDYVYPTPLEDCVAAVRALLTQGSQYGIDTSRIALLGDSAGGNLTAAVSLKLRDKKIEPMLKLQVMVYPALQAVDLGNASYRTNQYDSILPRKSMAVYWLAYALGSDEDVQTILQGQHIPSNKLKDILSRIPHLDRDIATTEASGQDDAEKNWQQFKDIFTDGYFSPLLAESLEGLPRALVLTVEQDVLKDDGVAFAQRLSTSGCDVTHVHYEAGFHGMFSWGDIHQADSDAIYTTVTDFVADNV